MSHAHDWPDDLYPLKQLTESIIGAAIEVHRVLGPGYVERIYENALVAELHRRDHKVERQVEAKVFYLDEVVGMHRADLLVDQQIILELKSVQALASVHEAQLRSTLKAAGKRVGLLLNFSQETLVKGLRRVIN